MEKEDLFNWIVSSCELIDGCVVYQYVSNQGTFDAEARLDVLSSSSSSKAGMHGIV